MMVIIFLIISLISFSGVSAQSPPAPASNFICDNYIEIQGQTNINDFHLRQIIPEKEMCADNESGWIHIPDKSYYEIRIPVRNFTANNHFVYKDFLSLLNASDFPYILIHINTNKFLEFYEKKSVYFPDIYISIAGVTRSYTVKCAVLQCNYGKKAIRGNKMVKLTDFKLDPPEKSFGLIQVKNELNIIFDFKIPDDLITNISEK